MKVHALLHVPFEGLAGIEPLLQRGGHAISSTRFWLDEPLPQVEEVDWLIIMGGPMGVNEESKYNWLKREKRYIEQAISNGKAILGICLGSQLIAEVLGGRIYKNKWKEIGWFPVRLTEHAASIEGLRDSDEHIPFHWHGDTFDLPTGATRVAYSEACEQQGFSYGQNVLALQFHPDATKESIELLLQHCPDDLTAGPFVQTRSQILDGMNHLGGMAQVVQGLVASVERICNILAESKE